MILAILRGADAGKEGFGLIKKRPSEHVFDVANYTFMILFSAACIYPFVIVLALSLNEGKDAMMGGIYLFPRVFTLENYGTMLGDRRLVGSLVISVYRTVVGAGLAVLLNSMFAYAISKRTLPGRKFFGYFILVPMYFSGGLIPYYLVCQYLGLINNVLVYVVPWIFLPFYILMLRVHFLNIPESLEESAKLDGAGYITIFFRILLPLSTPALATVALLSGVMHWNDWFDGTVMVSTDRLWPLQTLLLKIVQGSDIMAYFKSRNLNATGAIGPSRTVSVTPEALKMSMLMISVIPIVAIYPFLQKYIIKGLLIGSIKG